MARISELLPAKTNRVLLCGLTGSGKTTLARMLLAYMPNVIAYDPKGMLGWLGYKRCERLAEVVRHANRHRDARIIYAPVWAELNVDWQERFFEFIYKRKNTTLYVDEAYAVSGKTGRIPRYYHACLTRGRERNTPVYSATQRPAKLDQAIFSESEEYFVFRLSLPQDRWKITEIVNLKEEQIGLLGKREFYYANINGEVKGPLTLNLE